MTNTRRSSQCFELDLRNVRHAIHNDFERADACTAFILPLILAVDGYATAASAPPALLLAVKRIFGTWTCSDHADLVKLLHRKAVCVAGDLPIDARRCDVERIETSVLRNRQSDRVIHKRSVVRIVSTPTRASFGSRIMLVTEPRKISRPVSNPISMAVVGKSRTGAKKHYCRALHRSDHTGRTHGQRFEKL